MSEIFQNYASMQIFASILFEIKGIYNACVFKITYNFRRWQTQYLFSYDKVNIGPNKIPVFLFAQRKVLVLLCNKDKNDKF